MNHTGSLSPTAWSTAGTMMSATSPPATAQNNHQAAGFETSRTSPSTPRITSGGSRTSANAYATSSKPPMSWTTRNVEFCPRRSNSGCAMASPHSANTCNATEPGLA